MCDVYFPRKIRKIDSYKMKCHEIHKENPSQPVEIMNLDRALHDLGMLSAITEARRDYLKETKSNLGIMRMNTRYKSNVTVGFCMKRVPTKNRLFPYPLPVRHRTKSENSDPAAEGADCQSREICNAIILEPLAGASWNTPVKGGFSSIKRCQSLESLSTCIEPESSQEMDCVSTRIQKLQVDE